MDDPALVPPIQSIDDRKVFFIGVGLTFLLCLICMVANFIKPASVPAEPIWGFASLFIGHSGFAAWKQINQ